jgi:hypothetical protein
LDPERLAGQPPFGQHHSMNDSEYRGGLDPANMWGCAVSALIGFPIMAYLTLVDALGDCTPDTNCHKGFLSNVALPTVGIVTVVFLSVRWMAKVLRRGD